MNTRIQPTTDEQVAAGQAVYTRFILMFYDTLVMRINSPFAWRCPPRRMVAHYNRHVTDNHLDVGVGTGYFLNHCRFPSRTPRIVLMDLNRNSLDSAARRIRRYSPLTHHGNVLEPIAIDGPGFDSVGINYLLHCLPGSIGSTKAVVFDYLARVMNPGAVLFGATILEGPGVSHNRFGQYLLRNFNERGIFTTHDDNLEDLERALGERFHDVSVELVGSVAIFSGRTGIPET